MNKQVTLQVHKNLKEITALREEVGRLTIIITTLATALALHWADER